MLCAEGKAVLWLLSEKQYDIPVIVDGGKVVYESRF